MSRIWQTLFTLALLAFAVQTVRISGFLFYHGLQEKLDAERAAHKDTKRSYADAQRAAMALDGIRLAVAAALQETINEDTSARLDQRLAGLDAVYQRLRGEARVRAYSAPGGQQVPGVPDTACEPAATACDDGFPLDARYEASVYATQLDELITWVLRTANAGEGTPNSVEVPHGDHDDLPDAARRSPAVSGAGLDPSN